MDDLRHMTPAVWQQLDRLNRISDKLYIHIDMDVLDPREVMAHGNKVPNGPSSEQLARLFEEIFKRYPKASAIGFATIPPTDEGGLSIAPPFAAWPHVSNGPSDRHVHAKRFCDLTRLRSSRRQSPIEPGLRHGPFALDGGGRDSQRLGSFADVEAREEPQFHDATLAHVNGGERLEGLVEREHIHGRRLRGGRYVLEAQHRGAAAALAGVLPAGLIDEDLAHQLRRHRKEVRPVLQRQPLHIHESQIDLMHERRRLESAARLFALEVAARNLAQFVVHERDETVERFRIALLPGQEQCRYIFHGEQSVIDS